MNVRDGQDPAPERAAEDEAASRLTTWKRMYLLWTSFHYGLNSGAITATVLGGVLGTVLGYDEHRPLFAILNIAAVLLVFMVAFSAPGRQARAYIEAWRDLSSEFTAYKAGRSSVDSVLGAIRRGEAIISGKDPF